MNTWVKSKLYRRNLNIARTQISRICGNLNLPKIVKYESEHLYLKTLKKNLVVGHSILGIVCACIYYCCKKHHSRSFEELALQIDGQLKKYKGLTKHIRKCYSLISKELKLKYQAKSLMSLVPRYVSEASLPKDLTPLTTNFLNNCNADVIFNDKDSKGVAAAAVYLIAKRTNHRVTQIRMARIANVTDITVRSRIKELLQIT